MSRAEPTDDATRIRATSDPTQKIPVRYRASIVVLRGHAEGMEYPLTGATTIIGRDKTADIVVKDSLVSRQHAAIVYTDTGFVVKDLGSTNGTILNGKTVGQSPIANRDKVSIGDTTIQFILEDAGSGKVFEIR